jgi:hypothetical protein
MVAATGNHHPPIRHDMAAALPALGMIDHTPYR